jgi:DNA polymerase III sliding clamp (beta) subunit (PCNA family)
MYRSATDASIRLVEFHISELKILIQSSVIEGWFPNYDSIIPDFGGKSAITFDRKKMIETMKSGRSYADPLFKSLHFAFEKEKVVISSKLSTTKSHAFESTGECSGVEKTFDIRLNIQLLIRACESFKSKRVAMLVKTNEHPIMVQADEATESDPFVLVMPVRDEALSESEK